MGDKNRWPMCPLGTPEASSPHVIPFAPVAAGHLGEGEDLEFLSPCTGGGCFQISCPHLSHAKYLEIYDVYRHFGLQSNTGPKVGLRKRSTEGVGLEASGLLRVHRLHKND